MSASDQPIRATAAPQRGAGPRANNAGQGEMAGRSLIAATEPVQAVLVNPAEQAARPGRPATPVIRHRRFLMETQARLFRLALCWSRGPVLRERQRLAEAQLVAIGDAAEQARQRRRLAHAWAVAEALGGPPSHAITSTPEVADVACGGIADVVGFFFRLSTATAAHERRRRAAHLLDHLQDGEAVEHARALWRHIEALSEGEPGGGRGDDAA
jgi:hypothetical protein